MCGRFTLRTPTNAIVEAFSLIDAPDLKPRYNIASNPAGRCRQAQSRNWNTATFASPLGLDSFLG
jgi:putative SOS response-associated peptidase YedK